jgi:hypothetical protein
MMKKLIKIAVFLVHKRTGTKKDVAFAFILLEG